MRIWKHIILVTCLSLAFFFFTSHAQAFTITSDPQYLVMNFSEINELDWATSEDRWQLTIKPRIVAQLNQLKKALPAGTPNRRLAWSTLEEYMNTPLDTPSSDSYYAIKMRRILEIAEEENLPVFLPLNGYQWWDELPELYNWWDPDGTHTAPAFFNRQRTPDFKDRFIRGYNPNNIWNVEWQTPTTPMQLNWRNWGGGGFRLAPPPNILSEQYQTVQRSRLTMMLRELATTLERWEQEGKGELFAGLTIGTEVSLNASVTPQDEFMPYGYRSVQDLVCPQDQPTCGVTKKWNGQEMNQMREHAVHRYLEKTARFVTTFGIPKQRIYTHVWGEVEPSDPRYVNYASATFTPYARPGMSFYGHAQDPFGLSTWKNAMHDHGNPSWGAVEYSTDKTLNAWQKGMKNTFDAAIPAKVVVLYNWTEHKDTPAMQALATALQATPTQPCTVPEIIPTSSRLDSSGKLTWTYLPSISNSSQETQDHLIFHLASGLFPDSATDTHLELPATQHELQLTNTKPGVYTWYLERTGCEGKQRMSSEPRTLTIPITESEDRTPAWVKWLIQHR